jgi:hypothetical protein
MRRVDLAHLIRASADIAQDDEIVVVDSQAILGQFPDAPPELCVSVEADVYPKNRPELSDVIDGSIGEGSPFHRTFGYYAQGVDEFVSKCVAGREKDVAFLRAAVRHRLVHRETLLARVVVTDMHAEVRELVVGRIEGAFELAPA